MEDGARTPTRSEIDTFKILANPEFASITKAEPKSFKDVALSQRPLGRSRNGSVRSTGSSATSKSKDSIKSLPKEIIEEESVYSFHKDSDSEKSFVDYLPPKEQPVEKAESVISKDDIDYSKMKAESEAEVAIEKEALLYEIELLEKQGLIKLQRKLSMEDTLEAIQYQYDRANMIISTQQSVEWAKNGIKMGSTMLETLARKFNVTLIDGFSNNLCKDMNKFNQPLTKMVRKYWRKGSSSPEMEFGMIIMTSLVMTILSNRGLGGSTKEQQPNKPEMPKEESKLKPPNLMPKELPKPSGPTSPPPHLPEWAKSALKEPLAKPEHFAKVDTFPELARGPPLPVMPVNYQKQSQTDFVAPVAPLSPPFSTPLVSTVQKSVELTSPLEPETTRRISLASPKTRRKKEMASELNLDF